MIDTNCILRYNSKERSEKVCLIEMDFGQLGPDVPFSCLI